MAKRQKILKKLRAMKEKLRRMGEFSITFDFIEFV